jgi:hypothetical protein
VKAKDLGCLNSQRAIKKDINGWNFSSLEQLVQGIDQFLRSAHGKRRDNDLPFFLNSFQNDVSKGGSGLARGFMVAHGIGTLHDQEIDLFNRNRITDNRQIGGTDIAAKG